MSPGQSPSNPRHSYMRCANGTTDQPVGLSGCDHLANSSDVIGGKSANQSSFGEHVLGVVFLGSFEQVRRAKAFAVVAMVQYAERTRVAADNNKGHAVDIAAPDSNELALSVSGRAKRSRPFNARVGVPWKIRIVTLGGFEQLVEKLLAGRIEFGHGARSFSRNVLALLTGKISGAFSILAQGAA